MEGMSSIKNQLLALLDQDEEFRLAVAAKLGIMVINQKSGQDLGNQEKLWQNVEKLWIEVKSLRENQEKLWIEQRRCRKSSMMRSQRFKERV
jgi:hypothetical protein